MRKQTIFFVLTASILVASQAQAQQATNLKNMPAVMHKWLLRSHRIEVAPSIGITLNDAYTRSLLLDVNAAYHLNDWLGIGLDIAYGAPLKTGLTEDIEAERSKVDGTSYSLSRSYLNLIALPYVSFTPFSGKFVVFDRFLGYADLHIDIGAGLAYVGATGSLGSKATWNAMVGVGMRYFPIKGLSIILNFRDYMVPRILNMPKFGTSKNKLTNNLAVLVGVGFYFPSKPKRTP